MYQLSRRNSAYLRIYHWLLVGLLLVIVPTGFFIHQPFPFLYINFRVMFSIHVSCGFALSYLLMTRAYYAILNQNYQSILFTWQDFKELPAVFKYYLFLSAVKPPIRKYNAAQRLIYTVWFIFLTLANISGAFAYKVSYFLPVAKVLGGIHSLALMTLITALLFSFTIPLHIYLAFVEDVNNLQSIFSGYTYTRQPGCPQIKLRPEDIIQERLPGKWLWQKLRHRRQI